MSSHRFLELVVLARRLVTPAPGNAISRSARKTARRQIGGEITRFSFRLAFMIDLVYVGAGGLGGAALSRATRSATPVDSGAQSPCVSSSRSRLVRGDSTAKLSATQDGRSHGYWITRR